jgi:hypothetical protein
MTSPQPIKRPDARIPGEVDSFTILRYQRDTFEADADAMACFGRFDLPVAVLNGRRHVILANECLRHLPTLPSVDLASGPLPGEVFGCRHAASGIRVCGSLEACDRCGANLALRDCLLTREPLERKCRLGLAGSAQALEFRARVEHVRAFGAPYLVLALEGLTLQG